MAADSTHQDLTQAEPTSIFQQAVVEHAATWLNFAANYASTLDKAATLIRDSKQVVKDAGIARMQDSIASEDTCNAVKIANLAQGVVLLTAAELLPESVPGVMAMALPVKGAAARTGEVPVAGAMYSSVEKSVSADVFSVPLVQVYENQWDRLAKGDLPDQVVDINLPVASTPTLEEIDGAEYARLAHDYSHKTNLAQSAWRLDAAI